jgi:Ca-activated chloride channel family protein
MTFSGTSWLKESIGTRGELTDKIPLILRSICIALLILAVCRPQLYSVLREVKSSGVDIILCLDTSGSMQAIDFKLDDKPVDRLTAVKKVVTDFIKKREHDRIGLVVFGKYAFTQSPLTMDKGLLLGLINRLEIGMAGDNTAIGSALAVAGKRIKDIPAHTKLVILLTDGRNNFGDVGPLEAAEALNTLGIKIYTIGVGSHGPVPFKVRGFLGERTIYQRVDLDESILKQVAEISKGKYFLASNSERLAEIYDLIDQAEKTDILVKEFFNFEELYPYFLIPSLILLFLEIFSKSFLIRSIP